MLKKNRATNQHTLSLIVKLLTFTLYMVNATNNIGTVTNRKKSVAPRFIKDKIIDPVQSAECLLRQTARLPIGNQRKHLFSFFICAHDTKVNLLNLRSNMQLVGRIRIGVVVSLNLLRIYL